MNKDYIGNECETAQAQGCFTSNQPRFLQTQLELNEFVVTYHSSGTVQISSGKMSVIVNWCDLSRIYSLCNDLRDHVAEQMAGEKEYLQKQISQMSARLDQLNGNS